MNLQPITVFKFNEGILAEKIIFAVLLKVK
jgi:hypothetical protein